MSANTNQASKTAVAARQAEAWAIKPYSGLSDPRRQMRLVPMGA